MPRLCRQNFLVLALSRIQPSLLMQPHGFSKILRDVLTRHAQHFLDADVSWKLGARAAHR
jgi:hypothetical protein